MNDSTNPVFGIDFGTSYSRIARWDGTKPILYQLLSGRGEMASAVYVHPGTKEVLVGDIALKRGLITPEHVVQNIKRHIGEEGYTVTLGGKVMTPTEVVANILMKLVSDVQGQYPSGSCQLAGAVITHPYCFKYPQIAALREAADKAGIKVLRLVPDTVVVPLVYEFKIGAEEQDELVMVFDLGGGTLDVTVLHVVYENQQTTVEVIATGGDDRLGGPDFDEAIINVILDRAGLDLSDYDEITRVRALAKVREQAIEAKIALSSSESAYLTVPNVVHDRHIEIELSRADIEDACRAHLRRIREILEDVMTRSGLTMGFVGRVIATGAASRISAVRKVLVDATGMEPYIIDPDYSVVRGATTLAAAEASRLERCEFVLKLRTPYAIGIPTADGKFSTLIPEYSHIPCEITKDLRSGNTQTANIQLDVLQGTSDKNRKIGDITIKQPPKAGSRVRVTLGVDAQQMVSFRVETDAGTTQGMLPTPGSTQSKAQAAAPRVFCPEADGFIEELERATGILPTPIARVAAQITSKMRAGEPPDASDAAELLREWFWFAVDCLLADYFMGARQDIEVLQLLTRSTKDDPGAIRVALAERLIALAKQGHIAAEAPALVEVTEALLREVRNVANESRPPDTSETALPLPLDGTKCRCLTDLTKLTLRAIRGFIMFAGYGDSVYRFQGAAPTKELAPDAPSVRHGECVLVNVETAQSLILSRFWEIRKGPTLRRRETPEDLPSLREWTVERTQIVLVNVLLQDLIVNAIMLTNDPQLSMSTITAASVAHAAGEDFRRQTRGKHVEFGDVVSTPAGALAAKEVYHACTMGGTRPLQGDDLRSLLGKVLLMATTSGHSSVAFPLVGASYGIEATDIAANYVQAFREHTQSNSLPSLIVISTPHANDPIAEELAGALDAHVEKAAFASKKAHVFISANHADYNHAAEIYRFLKSRGVAIFFSQESLPQLGNSDYRREIDRALDDAQCMIVVTSSVENVQSSWVEAEWGFFINEKRSGRKSGNMITLAVGSLRPSDLPPSLRYYEVLPFQPDAFERLLGYIGR